MKSKILKLFIPLCALCALLGLAACNGGENPENSKTALATPEISIADNVISWAAVENADLYEVFEGDTEVARQAETTYTVSKTEKGTYKFKVKAANSAGDFAESKFSNEVAYVLADNKLAAPQISKQNNVISWTAVENADGYEVYENGELVSSQSETSYTITHTEAGTYKYTVRATCSGGDYTESELSNEISHIISVQLAAPQISIEGKVISWQAIPHAETYVIYENGVVLYQSWTRTSYEIEQTLVGNYTYCVASRSSDPAFKMSANSNTLGYEVVPTALATPTGLAVEGNILSWNAVDDGSEEYNPGYNVYENDLLVSKRQADSFYVIPGDHETGEFAYTVKAIPAGRDSQHLESAKSAPLNHTITDDRTPLATPQNLRKESRQVEKNPGSGDGEMVEMTYLVWDGGDGNATGYFVYDSGRRIYATQAAEYSISEATPGTHVYQIKAISSNAAFKPSELSGELEYVVTAENTAFKINIDKENAAGFNAEIKVALWAQDGSGLPYTQIPNTEKTIAAGENSATITYTNNGRYVAKLSGLPSGYAATEVKLSAAVTEGTIKIYAGTGGIVLNRATKLSATAGEYGTVGVDRNYLFVAPTRGRFAIEREGNLICAVNGVEKYTFAADAGEAVAITVNCQSAGEFKFTVVERSKQYINFGEMGDGLSGESNVLPDGQETTTFYMKPSAEPKLYKFVFTTATMSNTRFVTLTINGVDYEFDGDYCTTRNIVIPASATDITITAKLYGTAAGEGLASVHFYVIPLSED